MAIRVGINGFGRIGRLVFRRLMGKAEGLRGGRHQRHHRHQDAGLSAEVRQHPSPLSRRGRPRRPEHHRRRQEDQGDGDQGPGHAALEGLGRGRGAGEHRHLHRPRRRRQVRLRQPPRRRRPEGRPQRPGQGRARPDLRAGRERRPAQARAQVHLQRQLHDQLPGPGGQGAAREVRHRQGPDDHDPLLHQRPAGAGHAAQGPLPHPGGRPEHHPHHAPAPPRRWAW